MFEFRNYSFGFRIAAAPYKEARKLQFSIKANRRQSDPEKAAEVLIKIAREANPPLHLFLGSDAFKMANAKIAAVERDLENWQSLTVSTDFESAGAA